MGESCLLWFRGSWVYGGPLERHGPVFAPSLRGVCFYTDVCFLFKAMSPSRVGHQSSLTISLSGVVVVFFGVVFLLKVATVVVVVVVVLVAPQPCPPHFFGHPLYSELE